MIAVIGDIHGCYYTLKELYNDVVRRTDRVYSVGDLIDRGNFSKDVMQFCIDYGIKPVRGNHEDILLRAAGLITSDKYEMNYWAENHILNGGKKTYQSYSSEYGKKNISIFENVLREAGHMDFLINLPGKIEFDGLIITHAGISKFSNENIWHRERIDRLDKFQVVGHTPNKSLVHKPGWFANIDTGCVYGNKLTAAIVDEKTGVILDLIQKKVHKSDSEIELM